MLLNYINYKFIKVYKQFIKKKNNFKFIMTFIITLKFITLTK